MATITCPAPAALREKDEFQSFRIRDSNCAAHLGFTKKRTPINLSSTTLVLLLVTTISCTSIFGISDLWEPFEAPGESKTQLQLFLLVIAQIMFWSSSLFSILYSSWTISWLMRRSWTYVRVVLTLFIISVSFTLMNVVAGIHIDFQGGLRAWAEIFTLTSWTILTALYLTVLLGDEVQGKLGWVTGIRTWWRISLEEKRKARHEARSVREKSHQIV